MTYRGGGKCGGGKFKSNNSILTTKNLVALLDPFFAGDVVSTKKKANKKARQPPAAIKDHVKLK